MRAAVVVALALLSGCWNFGALAHLYHSNVDGSGVGGNAPQDLGTACSAGASCTTGKPGPCSAGHIQCIAGAAQCVSDTPPITESCFNNSDDDCDGTIDNGCPDHLELGMERVLSFHGGMGGSAHPARCPPNFFVVATGFWGNDPNSAATGIELTCATFTLMKGKSSYSVTKSLFSGTVLVQGNEATQTDQGVYPNSDCSSGLLASTWFTSNVSLDSLTTVPTYVVSGFGAHCASANVQLSSTNKLDITFSRQGSANDERCYMNGSLCLGPTIEDDCAANEVLVGFNLELGTLMDGVSAVCAPVVTVYK
jgi:hypothetical protein